MIQQKPVRIRVSHIDKKTFVQKGDHESKRYQSMECALDDCIMQSKTNTALVTKDWNKPATDPYDYYIQIYD